MTERAKRKKTEAAPVTVKAEESDASTVSGEEEIVAENTEQTDVRDNELEEMRKALTEINDKYLRLSAEFDNYRKRTFKEKLELNKYAGEDLLKQILPVMDNFERALANIEKSADVAALKEGVVLIYNGFKDFLAANGVREIDSLNKTFNTDEHDAVVKIQAPTEDMKGKVVDCIEKGYYLNGKVMRYAKVVVGE